MTSPSPGTGTTNAQLHTYAASSRTGHNSSKSSSQKMLEPRKAKRNPKATRASGRASYSKTVNATTSRTAPDSKCTAEASYETFESSNIKSSTMPRLKKEMEDPGNVQNDKGRNDQIAATLPKEKPRDTSPGSEDDNEILALKLMESLENMMGMDPAKVELSEMALPTTLAEPGTAQTEERGSDVPQMELDAAESIIMLHALPRHLQDVQDVSMEDVILDREKALSEVKDDTIVNVTNRQSSDVSGSPIVSGTPPPPSSSRSSPVDTDIPDVNVDKEGITTVSAIILTPPIPTEFEKAEADSTDAIHMSRDEAPSKPAFASQMRFVINTVASQEPDYSDIDENSTNPTGHMEELHEAMEDDVDVLESLRTGQTTINQDENVEDGLEEPTKLPHFTEVVSSANAMDISADALDKTIDDGEMYGKWSDGESSLSSLDSMDFELSASDFEREMAIVISGSVPPSLRSPDYGRDTFGNLNHSISASSAQTPASMTDMAHTPSASEIAAGVSTDSCGACKRAVPSVNQGARSHIVATLWIRCDGCKTWYHNVCVHISEKEITDIDKYHCASCVPTLGPTTYRRKSTRVHTSIDYVSLNEGSQAPFKASGDSTQHPYVEPINRMQFLEDKFPRLNPELLNLEFFEQGDGFKSPVVIPAEVNPRPEKLKEILTHKSGDAENYQTFPVVFKTMPKDMDLDDRPDVRAVHEDFSRVAVRKPSNKDALGMVMPADLTVRKVAELVGFEEKVEVLDVLSQSQDKKTWDFFEWVDYFESPTKDRVKNVISQEISHTALAAVIRRPEVVEQLDLAQSVWPADMKSTFPKVQLYCLMSVGGSYTDFHIDFGGSSVFYHIVSGKKTFLFVPPTKHNLSKYEAWSKMADQNSIWYPGTLGADSENGQNLCYRVDLSAGDTMLIPSGWIHAVLTPEDSLVIGGNFLTRLAFEQQIKIVEIEKNTNVHIKFRYPQFQKVMWFTALDYLQKDPLPDALFDNNKLELVFHETTSRPVKRYSKYELDGLPHLAEFLLRTALIIMGVITEGISLDKRNRVKASIPKHISDPLSTVQLFGRWIAWKRNDSSAPIWAMKDWVPDKNVANFATEKKPSQAKLKQMKKAAEDKKRREDGQQRDGLRKQRASIVNMSPSPATTPTRQNTLNKFTSNTKAAADKLFGAPRSAKKVSKPQQAKSLPPTPEVTKKIASPSSLPKPSRQKTTPSRPSNAQNSPVKLSPVSFAVLTPNQGREKFPPGFKISPVSEEIAQSIREKYNFVSSPKNSILGPRRTACDDCRRQKIACKHKDVVAKAEEELIKVIQKPSTPIDNGERPKNPIMPSNGGPVAVQNSSGEKPYRISKNGRPVACDACKRSRRRCTHNGQEDFPPARKRTNLLRGTPWEKPPAPLPEPPAPRLHPFPRNGDSRQSTSRQSERSSSLSSLDSQDIESLGGTPPVDDRVKLAQLVLQQHTGDETPFAFAQSGSGRTQFEASASNVNPVLSFPNLIYTSVESQPKQTSTQDFLRMALTSPPQQSTDENSYLAERMPDNYDPALQRNEATFAVPVDTVSPAMVEKVQSIPDDEQPLASNIDVPTHTKRARENDSVDYEPTEDEQNPAKRQLLDREMNDGDAVTGLLLRSQSPEKAKDDIPAGSIKDDMAGGNIESMMDGIEASRQDTPPREEGWQFLQPPVAE